MWKEVLYNLFSYGILIYSVTLLASYIFITIYSIGETNYCEAYAITDSLLRVYPKAIPVLIG